MHYKKAFNNNTDSCSRSFFVSCYYCDSNANCIAFTTSSICTTGSGKGVAGDGPFGFQIAVVNAKPGDEGYSPLWQVNEVTWNGNATARELKSVQEITTADQNGELSINNTDIVVKHPAIQWQNGSLMVREDADNISDDTPYTGEQVLNIDRECGCNHGSSQRMGS